MTPDSNTPISDWLSQLLGGALGGAAQGISSLGGQISALDPSTDLARRIRAAYQPGGGGAFGLVGQAGEPVGQLARLAQVLAVGSGAQPQGGDTAQGLAPFGLAQDPFVGPALVAPERPETPDERTARLGREAMDLQHRYAIELEQQKGLSGAAEATIRGQYGLQAAQTAHPGYRPIGEQLQLLGAEQSGQMKQLTTQLASAGTLAELRSRTDLALEGLRSDSAARIAQINADTSLSVVEKQRLGAQERNSLELQIANITAASSRYAAEVSREVGLHQADISERIAQLNQEAETARAQGNTALEQERIAASERMQADLRVVDREKLALDQYLGERGFKQQERATAANLLTSIMGLQAQERSSRSQSAIELFKALASMAPQQNLVNAYFLLRGQAPPPSSAEAALGQLGPLLGLTQGQQGAIGEAAGLNKATLAPFLQELLGVQLQPTGAAAGA